MESSGLWSFLLRSSPTFGDMLRRAERYIRIVFRYTRLVLMEEGERVAAVCDHPDPSPFGRHEQEVCFFLGQWLTWGRSL
ncbi:MAG: AraC family transcriptional regulator ligand-binding domain-containing protein, partial [Pseudolabrys sp.]